MKMFVPNTRLPVITLVLLLLPSLALAGGIKKWVDSDGVTHYGTSIPPEYLNKEHTELNSRGIAVKRVKRARTAEEIAREKELKQLRIEQDKAIAEQRAKDRILLNMFRNEEDLEMVREGKIAQVDSQIKLKQAYVERLKKRLAQWQAAAAKRERQGKKPTEKQLENLQNIQQLLENSYADIVEKQASKRRISTRYTREMDRFRQLKSGFRASSTRDIEAPREEPSIIPVAGAYVCEDHAQCNRVWGPAKAWTKAHSGTPIEVIGDRILVTKVPRKPDEISLTLSRLKHGNVERLFLDIVCQKSVAGGKLCESKPVQALRDQFVAAMQTAAQETPVTLSNK